jgi:hypoxanthine phosphoribosyltransferase
MLDRPARRIVPQAVDYRGLELGDEYVLGYGLHVRDLYRNVPYVVAADRDTLVTRPDAYVDDLYRRPD